MDKLTPEEEKMLEAIVSYTKETRDTVQSITGYTPLTPMEYKITELVKQAKSNKGIAEVLGIGEGTVRTHLRSIFKKLNIKSRAELIIKEL